MSPIYKDVVHAISHAYASELKTNCKSPAAFLDPLATTGKDPNWLTTEELIAQGSFTIMLCKRNLNQDLTNFMDAVYTLPNLKSEEGMFIKHERTNRKENACLKVSSSLVKETALQPAAAWFFVREFAGLPRLISKKELKKILHRSDASCSRYKRKVFISMGGLHDLLLLHLHGPLQDAGLIPSHEQTSIRN